MHPLQTLQKVMAGDMGRRSGQPGEITRLIGCDFGRDLIHRKVFWVMPTWVTPGVQRVGDDECAFVRLLWHIPEQLTVCQPNGLISQ